MNPRSLALPGTEEIKTYSIYPFFTGFYRLRINTIIFDKGIIIIGQQAENSLFILIPVFSLQFFCFSPAYRPKD
jgi:hypothetical protein